MVRKDFILQNFVGTGGLCDARAVRCHERIARWHCMCEHQLAHISEFVTKQSQQNIQELGQTIKSLNQFYDDAKGRSLIELPDESGAETRTDLTSFSHGCCHSTVQGPTPSDYDGTELGKHDEELVSLRMVGKSAVGSSFRGTAEPEIRGLYILQTMNNDRGLEVRRYVSSLSQERPEIYRTEPVQLAISVFKVSRHAFVGSR